MASARLAGAAAEEVGEHRPDEDHRRHAQRELRAVAVGGVDDQVVAAADGLAPAVVDRAEREARDGERVDDDLVAIAEAGRPVERQEEGRRREPAGDADERAEHDPLCEGLRVVLHRR